MQAIIRVEKLAKIFNQHQALHAADLNIRHGEMVALPGPSGSGKSTLLRHLGDLITGDESVDSHIELLDRAIQHKGRPARDIRKSRTCIGYIFQQSNLVNRLSVLENVLTDALGSTPFWRTCFSYLTREQKQRVLQAPTRIDMVYFVHQRTPTFFGGQQQRVAIARTLMQQTKVIFAGEPITSLDPGPARIMMDTLHDVNQNDDITVVAMLHQVGYVLRYCERIVTLCQGYVLYDGCSQRFDNERPDHLYRSVSRTEENVEAAWHSHHRGKRMNTKIIVSLAFTSMFSPSALLNPAYAEKQGKAPNFGIVSTESQQNPEPQWMPLLQDMEKKLSVKVDTFFAPDYTGTIQGMRFSKVDITWYGNLSAMEAVDRINGQVFVQMVMANGSSGYWGMLIINENGLINNLSNLLAEQKDLTFGSGDPNSTSDFFVPGYYIFTKDNISVSDFKRTASVGYKANALAVADKQVNVATGSTESLDRLKTFTPEKLRELKVIWKSPLIPGDPIIWRRNLSGTTEDKVYGFFMNYGKTSEGEVMLKRLGWAPFHASSGPQLVPVRQPTLFKEVRNVKDNKGLSKQDELVRTTVIQAQPNDLDRLNNTLSATSSVSKAVQQVVDRIRRPGVAPDSAQVSMSDVVQVLYPAYGSGPNMQIITIASPKRSWFSFLSWVVAIVVLVVS